MSFNSLNIIDAIIILIILLGGVVGFKEGAIKKLTSIVGLVLVVVFAFMLKNQLSVFFYENLPFFDLWGVFKGIQVLNIIFYEMLAFLIIASMLTIVYRLLLGITGLIEKVLKATVILSIPSKIIGFIIGLIENYIWVYIVLFILTLPIFNIKDLYESKLATKMLSDTPYLSKYTEKTVEIYNDLYDVIDNKADKSNEEINEESLKLMLKYDIITRKSAQKLVDKNKISVTDVNFLDNYN